MKKNTIKAIVLCAAVICASGCASVEQYKYDPLPIGLYKGKPIYRGPGGGIYTITKSGHKRYLPRTNL